MRIPNTPTSTIIQQSYQQWCLAEIMTKILNYQIFRLGSMSGSRTQLDLGWTEVQHQPLPVHCSNDGRTFPVQNASKDSHTPTPVKWQLPPSALLTYNKWGKHITVIIHPPLACKCFTPKRWWGPKDKPQVPSHPSAPSLPGCMVSLCPKDSTWHWHLCTIWILAQVQQMESPSIKVSEILWTYAK